MKVALVHLDILVLVIILLQHEYMSYMEKKTSKRQTTIITLSDHNKEQIRNILLEKEIMEKEFDERKQGIKKP